MATKEQTAGFFGGSPEAVAPRSGGFELLPTTKRDAPADRKWLVQFVEDSVEVRHSGDDSKTPGHPYISYSLSILEPVEYENRRVFGMFYYAPEPTDDHTEDEADKIRESQGNVKYMIDAILGEGTFDSIPGGDLEEALENLCPMLEEVVCVATIGKQGARNGYEARNRVETFDPASTWVGEDEE